MFRRHQTGCFPSGRSGQAGSPPGWPDFFTRDSVLGSPATFEIEGTLVSSTDSDTDGLPDDWEQFHLASLAHSAGDDPDGDGVRNDVELAAGTDPADAASALKIISLRRDAGGDAVLRFPFAASRHYTVEYSGDLQTWSAVENPGLLYHTAPGVAEWRDDGSQTGGPAEHRFYRINVR